MSHKAVNWALEQKQLKPGVWVVLIQLADRHNKDTRLVFPEQALLANDCNISRATLNRHLSELEAGGLIFRVQRVNPSNKKSMATHYILQPDFANPPNIDSAVGDYRAALQEAQNGNNEVGRVSNCDTDAVSQKTPFPCLNSGDSRVSNCDTNLVKEPKDNPNAPARGRGSDFNEFWKVCAKPRDEANSRKLFDAAVASGVDGAQIILAAQAYAREFSGEKHRYAVGSNDWLSGRRWAGLSGAEAGAASATKSEPAVFYAAWVNSGKPIPPSAVSPALAREMLGRQLVTSEQLRAAGIAA